MASVQYRVQEFGVQFEYRLGLDSAKYERRRVPLRKKRDTSFDAIKTEIT